MDTDASTTPNPTGISGCVSLADYARLYRSLRTLSAGNRTLARATDEEDFLRDMCRAIVGQGGYRMAWVGRANDDAGRTITPVAWQGVADDFFEQIQLSWGDDVPHPTAKAIRSGQPQVGHLVRDDPALAHLQEQNQRWGIASVSSFPLLVEGRVFGNLTIAAGEVDAFGKDEVDVLAELAEDTAFGIRTLRARKQQHEAEKTILRMAWYDGLTGLPNRARFTHQLAEILAEARRQARPLAVCVVIVDHFREVNEVLGPRQGDELLQQVASKLAAQAGGDELLARAGDNAFALVWPDTDADAAGRKAARWLAPFDEPQKLAELNVDARLRIGIALFPGHGAEPDVLLRRATLAAREARRANAGYSVFSGDLDRDCARNLSLIAELHQAITQNQLRLYCQPKVRFASGEACGAEALVRWEHPERGLVGPDRFIKLAEHAGLITPLTNWVLGAAFRQLYAWQAEGTPRTLAVNLSARDILDPHLVDRFRGLFQTWGVAPECVQIELTESALMEDPAGAMETLNLLRELGLNLAVDDFGTGFSSLSYLQRLPVDSIKIDQSFVGRMLDDEDSNTIVRSTIDLGHNLRLKVVAEGVENGAMWQRLAGYGCDVAQGFFIGQPISAEQFSAWRPPEGLIASLHA